MERNKKITALLLTYLVGTALSLVFAYFNSFPLIYPDTGTYLTSGFEFAIPFDRPVFYGLFLRFTSVGLSLWFTIFCQAFIGVFLIRELIFFLTRNNQNIELYTLITIGALSFFTSYSYTISEVIADSFTAFLILSVILWFHTSIERFKRILLILLISLCLVVHNSHFVIFFGTVMVLLLFNYTLKLKQGKLLMQLITIGFVSLFLNLSFNFLKHRGFELSKVGTTFLFARMLETGAIHKLIKDHPEMHDVISDNIAQIPTNTTAFLWDFEHSILYRDSCFQKKGCEQCWLEDKDLYWKYITQVIAYQPARKVYLRSLLTSFLKQVTFYKVEALGPLMDAYPVKINIKIYLPHDYPQYLIARQNKNTLLFAGFNRALWFTTFLTIIIIVASFWFVKYRPIYSALGIYIIFYLVNCLVCSSLAITTERYSSRVAWIMPLFAIIILVKLVTERKMESKKTFQSPTLTN